MDRYLAHTGYGTQQLPEPVDPHRRDNLWDAGAGDPGAHGRFDDVAMGSSWQLTARTAAGGLASSLGGAVRKRWPDLRQVRR
jgi:hypothetical protein